MREKDLPIDRTCHVVYSKDCKAQIQGAIARHYPEGEREAPSGRRCSGSMWTAWPSGGQTWGAARTFTTGPAAPMTALP